MMDPDLSETALFGEFFLQTAKRLRRLELLVWVPPIGLFFSGGTRMMFGETVNMATGSNTGAKNTMTPTAATDARHSTRDTTTLMTASKLNRSERTVPTRRRRLAVALMAASAAGATSLWTTSVSNAQDSCCGFQPAYRLQCETVVQKVPQTRYRTSYKTEMVEQEQISYRPVLRMREEMREYTVPVPVTETKYVEETYSVMRPVVETSYRDETMTRTRMVSETAEREETVTQYRPVTETQYYQQQYAVQRPVTETQMREQQYMVQRPVTETYMQTQQYTALRPTTVMENRTIDAGGYVAQQTVTPGQLQYGVGWNRAAYAVPGPLGIFSLNRGAPTLVPQYTPPTVQTQYAYRPNYINQQVARTTYVPEVQQVQTPVQVQRMQNEIVRQQVPVQVQRMETEMVTQNVPVQTTRMVPTVLKRKVPYTVQRPVTETLVRRVPVQQERFVREERVRKVPVQSTRMTYVTKKEKVQVPYYAQQEVRTKVLKPVTRAVSEPYTVMVDLPQQVVQRTPLTYVDPFSSGIGQGYSSFSPSVTSSVYQSPIEYGPTTPIQPYSSSKVQADGAAEVQQPSNDDIELSQPGSAMPEAAQTPLESVQRKFEDSDSAQPSDTDPMNAPEIDLLSPGGDDEITDTLPAPSVNDDAAVRGRSLVLPTGFRLRWNPARNREI